MTTMSTSNITIGGAGGIGSFVIQFLARQWPNHIEIFDFDEYEEVNSGSQFMSINELGVNKAIAAKSLAYEFSQYERIRCYGEFTAGYNTHHIAVAAFDNMKARKLMYDAWRKNNSENDEALFIDGRLTAESFEVYFVTPSHHERYLETIFDDSEAEELSCTLKATTHCGAMIGAVIINGIDNFLANIAYKEKVRELPFSIHYDMELFNWKTKE